MTQEVTAWIPQKEYEALQEFKAKMTFEQWRQHSYFMWNNFSMKGYEDWAAKQDQPKENERT